jgi:transposase-like protein
MASPGEWQVASQAVVIAIGLNATTGSREVLGLDVGRSEDDAFRPAFLRGLVTRGLAGVQMVVGDAHEGFKSPIAAVPLVTATIRTVFAQPEPEVAQAAWRQVANGFRSRYPKLATLLDEEESDVLAYLTFPLERVNREVKRRTDVVGIFPTVAAILPLVGMILAEQDDEWQVSKRYFSAESLARLASASLAPSPYG